MFKHKSVVILLFSITNVSLATTTRPCPSPLWDMDVTVIVDL